MLPEVVWGMPRFGTFNVHAALLPQYRGAAPINWAVINGEVETGVTTFFLDHDIDTGRVIEQRKFPIPDDADVEYVYDGLMNLGAEIALSTLDKVIEGDGKVESMPQDDSAATKHAPKIFKETCEIAWAQNAKNVYDFVRGLSPYPGSWTTLVPKEGKPLTMKVFKTAKTNIAAVGINPGEIMAKEGHLFVACADNMLEILELQISGKKRMLVRDFLNGFKNIDNYTCR